MTPERRREQIRIMNLNAGTLREVNGASDVQRSLCLIAHSLAALLSLESDKLRDSMPVEDQVEEEPESPVMGEQLTLFDV